MACWCFTCQGKPLKGSAVESLSGVFDGDVYLFDPDVDFTTTRSRVVRVVDEEEEDVLGPYESPSVHFELEAVAPEKPAIESCWGSLSVVMSSLCDIMEMTKEQYQHNHQDGSREFSFRIKSNEQERI